METLWQDVKYGLRMLAKAPEFTLVTLLTLALGIGANTAIFSVVYGVILRPLRYPQPERILQFGYIDEGEFDEAGTTYLQFKFLEENSRAFEHFAASTPVGFNLSGNAAAERVRGLHVSSDFFKVMGVRPALGREFSEQEDSGRGERVAILSHGVWNRHFGADPSTIGRTMLLDGEPFSVVGVMPAEFQTMPPADVWAPLALVAKTAGGGGNLAVIGRLRAGATIQQARAQMALLTDEWGKRYPMWMRPGRVLSVEQFQALISSNVRKPLFVLFGAIAFVLLIACANVANLLSARAQTRQKEIGIRIALGASRPRLMRQLLTESVLLALFGGALGLVLARWGLDLILAMTPNDLPRVTDIHLDVWALAFTLGASLLTGALFGLGPALQVAAAGPNDALKDASGRTTTGAQQSRLRSALVMGEIGLSLALLVGAGLLIRTFGNLLHTDAGFDLRNVLAIEIWSTAKHNDPVETANYYNELARRIEAIPGVQAAGMVAAGLPLERGGNTGVRLEDRNPPQLIGPDYREVSPGFFRAMGIPLLLGRYFTDGDSAQASRVVIVNESFARKYYPDRSPIGAQINMGGKNADYREIIGVVRDVKSSLDRPAPRTVLIPAAQASSNATRLFGTWFPVHVVVRTAVDPLSLRRAIEQQIRTADVDVPIGKVRTMEQALAISLAMQRFIMVLMSVFAGVALLLAAVGIYGLMAFSVAQRTHEIGVRMALGAQPADVLQIVLADGLRLALVGVAIGLAGALSLTRLLKTLLFGVSVTDPWTFAGVALLLGGVALAACWVPARRAARVDPMVALRYE